MELQQPSKTNEEFSSAITVLCILQDFQRTSNFLFYITGIKNVFYNDKYNAIILNANLLNANLLNAKSQN